MSTFRFNIPIQIRYGDLDPQWHVNNSRFLTFMEQARFDYLVQLQLWDGQDFFELGLIVADAHVAYLAPIFLGQQVRVWARVARLGKKSLTFVYEIRDDEHGALLATGETIMVAYDYHTQTSKPVPPDWREKILAYEETVQTA